VQVKSLGYENSNVQLRGDLANNRIIMLDDKSLDARVLDTVKHNLSLSRRKTLTFEEPAEPEDGWPAYNNYVLNNLNMPEKPDMKKQANDDGNTVEISFEVGKNGEPVNIKIEKSLCEKCDKEAIRLIKDGPKWKRKGKKGKRTTVTVPFNKNG
jgi:TonB family protein